MGRWNGMLLPPMIETTAVADAIAGFSARGARAPKAVGAITHVLTHAAMRVKVLRARAPAKLARGRMVCVSEFDQFAVPKITRVVVACALDSQHAIKTR